MCQLLKEHGLIWKNRAKKIALVVIIVTYAF